MFKCDRGGTYQNINFSSKNIDTRNINCWKTFMDNHTLMNILS